MSKMCMMGERGLRRKKKLLFGSFQLQQKKIATAEFIFMENIIKNSDNNESSLELKCGCAFAICMPLHQQQQQQQQ